MAEHFDKVLKSPINTSISKNLYSFSKASRFLPTPTSPCRRSFYNLKRFDARSTTFGFGNKSSLINREEVPPVGSYDRESQFLLNRSKKRGFSFGSSPRKGIDDEVDVNPGPGKYEKTYQNGPNISFSFRSKYEDPFERHRSQLGPGQYSAVPVMTLKGNYFVSNYRNSGCPKIGKTARFEDERTLPPGPGKYTDRLSINKNGHYFNSRFPSNLTNSFQGTARPPINEKSEAPGPGTYYVFSEFARN